MKALEKYFLARMEIEDALLSKNKLNLRNQHFESSGLIILERTLQKYCCKYGLHTYM